MAVLIQSHHPGTEEEEKTWHGWRITRRPDGRKHKATLTSEEGV